MKRVWTALFGLLLATEASGQGVTITELYTDRFRGYGGISFTCSIQSSSIASVTICNSAAEHAAFLAAVGNIPFLDCRMCDEFQHYEMVRDANIGTPLRLQLWVAMTEGPPVGGAARFAAIDPYMDAISQHAPTGPRSMPRSGTLELWSTFLSFSCQSYCGADLNASVNGLLTPFFTYFVTAFNAEPG